MKKTRSDFSAGEGQAFPVSKRKINKSDHASGGKQNIGYMSVQISKIMFPLPESC